MAIPFLYVENDLGRAGWLLLLELAGGAALGVFLGNLGYNPDFIVPAVWLFNLLPAWYISQAATRMGKNGLLYGVVSALGGALAAWAWLVSQDYFRQLERNSPSDRDQS